jgi:asparagine synthase (glutamine-hydrolysing)
MVEVLCHEPFYSSGTWTDPAEGIYVGWIARQGSFADRMPLRNERGDVTLTFSGEEFPEPGTPAAVKARGHDVEIEGPGYLVHRYEEEPDFPRALNGRFHGLVADRVRKTTMLFNDRYGMQRIYYHEGKEAFYFAAEAKAILAVRPELRRADPRGLGELVACGCVLENRTLFQGIHVLPPGSAWTFQNGALEKKGVYFEPREWEEQTSLDAEDYYTQLRDAFVSALPRYFTGRERAAVSLTGGLDTRIIMAWRKAPPGTLPCYTFGSMYRDNEDVKLARKVAKICGQSHQVITAGREFLSDFARYAERTIYLTDGCVEVGRTPDLYVNEEARKIAPVRMVGTYGSEILRQAVMFKPSQPVAGLFGSDMLQQVDLAKKTYAEIRKAHPVTFVAFRQSPWYHYGILMLEQTQVAVRTPYLDNKLVGIVYRGANSVTAGDDARVRLIREGNPVLGRLRTDRGVGDRQRLLARLYLEFTFKAEYAYDYGMPQWIARVDHAFKPLHLERVWIGRHKIFHFRLWYRDIIGGYVREMLLDKRSLERPYVEPKQVEAVIRGHLEGGRNYTTELHKLLSLELVHRLFLDS